MAAIFMVLAAWLMTAGVRLVSDASTQAKKRTMMVAEAENIARAGLEETLGWFKRQHANNGIVSAYDLSNGSVAPGQIPNFNLAPNGQSFTGVDQAFWPQNNTSTGQSNDDSAEPWIGIVFEYPLDSPVSATAEFWGRYEVAKVPWYTAGTPVPTYYPYAVHDISGVRYGNSLVNGDGAVWSITATAYVYRRMDHSVTNGGMWVIPYNQAPNAIIANTRVSTELTKLQLNMPTTSMTNVSSPVYVNNLSQLSFGNDQAFINGSVTFDNYAVISMNQN